MFLNILKVLKNKKSIQTYTYGEIFFFSQKKNLKSLIAAFCISNEAHKYFTSFANIFVIKIM